MSRAYILEQTRSYIDTRHSPQASSALTRPANGWTDARLGRVFGDSTTEEAKLSGGAIAGIVVGSIAALALVAAGGWYAWKRWHTGLKTVSHNNAGQQTEWQPPDRDRGERQPMQEQTNTPAVGAT